jgi:hypothetical protein
MNIDEFDTNMRELLSSQQQGNKTDIYSRYIGK